MATNPIAERRRLRQLEKLRLEREAAEALERARLQEERDRAAIEAEKLAQAAQVEAEKARRRAAREAEAARVAGIIQGEHHRIATSQAQYELLGAYCTREIPLLATPVAVVVVPPDEYARGWQLYVNKHVVLDTASDLHLYAQTAKLTSQRLRARAPSALAISRGGLLCVADDALDCIHMYAFATMFPPSGGFQAPDLLHVVTSADLRHPRGLAMDFLANELYVCDSAHHRVQVLSVETKGLVLHTPTARALSGGLSFPSGVDISHYHVVVADTGHGRLAIFTKRGVFVTHLGAKGRAPGQFWDPRDVKLANVRKNAVNRGTPPTTKGLNEHFEIVVADYGNYRIQVLRDDGSLVYIFSQHADATSLERHVGTFKQLTTALLRCLDHVGLHHIATAVASGGPFEARRRLLEYLHPSSIAFATVSGLLQRLADEKHNLRCPTALDIARNHQNAIVFADRDNARVCSYHYAGPKFEWAALPRHANVLQDVAGAIVDGTTAYVVDSAMHRVTIYEHVAVTPVKREWTPNGFLGAATYGNKIECAPGCHLGELQSPTAVALYAPNAATRWVLVSDSGNHRIQVFDAVTRRALHVLGSFGHRANGLDAPLGLSVFEGDVYCADQRNHRVAVFNIASTTPLGTYGTFGSRPGEFALPTDVAVVPSMPQYDGIDLGPYRDAKMVVSDTGNHRVQVLSLTGAPLFVFEHVAQGVRMVPMGLYVDAETGHILVCDASARAAILLFTPDGRFFHSFGGTLPEVDRLQRPVTVARVGDGFVVADASRLDLCSFGTTR